MALPDVWYAVSSQRSQVRMSVCLWLSCYQLPQPFPLNIDSERHPSNTAHLFRIQKSSLFNPCRFPFSRDKSSILSFKRQNQPRSGTCGRTRPSVLLKFTRYDSLRCVCGRALSWVGGDSADVMYSHAQPCIFVLTNSTHRQCKEWQ